ncbi:MAG: T9SS type A sorting domain-containing protein [Crocinitomicaceae bacterium]|nr:T9SS type A sorting domain-containing protein [Crocinitomicaceae bacterium]
MNKIVLLIWMIFPVLNWSQSFAPAAGQTGSTAIHKDSSIFIAWANGIFLTRGFLNITDTNYQVAGTNKASYGQPSDALGMAEGNPNDIVSLGDAGEAILVFDSPIVDGPGYDFAVFENSFSDTYLELATVAVSTDGINFLEFESTSETSLVAQVGPYANLQPEYIHNLAGKYRGGYGTPFDLNELSGNSSIDLQNIRFVKIKDCVGSIDPNYGTFDSQGTLINDPFPTPWESGGFDLDGVGVIHNQELLEVKNKELIEFLVYPNPSQGNFTIQQSKYEKIEYSVLDQFGREVAEGVFHEVRYELNLVVSPGIYWLNLKSGEQFKTERILIQ